MTQKNISLLVVDDSSVIRNLISRYAASMNTTVVATAANGEDAFSMYKLYRPDAVSMDLDMPGWGSPSGGGLACIRKIIEFDPDAKIVVVSALEDKSIGVQAIASGANAFLNKPLNPEKLFAVLREMVHDN